MGLQCLSAFSCPVGRSPIGWLRPPHPCACVRPHTVALASRSSRQDRSNEDMTPRYESALRLPLPSKDDETTPPPRGGSLHEVSSPTTFEHRGVRSTRAYLTRHLPASGFLTLLPVYSSPGLPACFIRLTSLGLDPSRFSPVGELARLFAGRFPSWRYRSSSDESDDVPPTSGAFSQRQSVRIPGSLLRETGRPIPSWAWSLSRVRPPLPGGRFPDPSPHALEAWLSSSGVLQSCRRSMIAPAETSVRVA